MFSLKANLNFGVKPLAFHFSVYYLIRVNYFDRNLDKAIQFTFSPFDQSSFLRQLVSTQILIDDLNFLSFHFFSFFFLRRLGCQQVNHQIYLKFPFMICLCIQYYLVKKKINIFQLLNLSIFLHLYTQLFFSRRLIQFKNGHNHPVLLSNAIIQNYRFHRKQDTIEVNLMVSLSDHCSNALIPIHTIKLLIRV